MIGRVDQKAGMKCKIDALDNAYTLSVLEVREKALVRLLVRYGGMDPDVCIEDFCCCIASISLSGGLQSTDLYRWKG